jgi:REP element-mobilizing transposase RayT
LNTDHADLLGQIINGKMILSRIGKIAEKCWLAISEHYPDAILHEFVIMPDHLHGIIELKRKDHADRSKNNIDVGIQNFESRQIHIQKRNEYQKIIPRSVGCIIRGFKIGVTKQLKKSIWQRNYYEHIIRSEASYKRIARYIINNPVNYEYRSNSSSIHKYDSKGSKF